MTTLSPSRGGVSWSVNAPNDGVSLRVSQPDGAAFERTFPSGQAPAFTPPSGSLPDGVYVYELTIAPVVSAEARAKAVSASESGGPIELPSGTVESGTFRVVQGALMLPEATTVEPRESTRGGGQSSPEQVITGDLTVRNSLCVGVNCADVETFGFDTIRLKGTDSRIQFDDTTTNPAFPTNNWQIRANSSVSGGPSFLGFVDQGATNTGETGTVVFQVAAGAPANSLTVDASGRLGLRTATPVQDMHLIGGNAVSIRLDPNGSGNAWDLSANEANFFLNDVVTGHFPFRVRAGGPNNSLVVDPAGNVGVGRFDPVGKLHVSGTGNQLSIFQSSITTRSSSVSRPTASIAASSL